MNSLDICFVAAEVTPFAKTGGLGDVSSALPRTLHEMGHDVRLFMPFYGRIDASPNEIVPVDFLRDVPLRCGRREVRFSAFVTKLPRSSMDVYLIHCPELYDRPEIYTSDPDEPVRFGVLSRAAIECCQRMGWRPDVFHSNDWHTALLPLYLRTHYDWDRLFAKSRTVLTIHNVGYQGMFRSECLGALDLAEHGHMFYREDLVAGVVNFLRTGILYADFLSTVSPTHAAEIQTPKYGMGLSDLLSRRSDRLFGILNGIDTSEWDPETDSLIPFHYSAADPSAKANNRESLLGELGLAAKPEGPVVGVVSRLVKQKGMELLQEVLPGFVGTVDCRLAVLGSGEPAYEDFFRALQEHFPGRVCFYGGFSNELAHRIEAGADIFLMPSLYEPCGLNQMYSLRYGTAPVVRRTGGLADSVRSFDRTTGEGTGFLFEHANGEGLSWALGQALDAWRDREAWKRLVRNGMSLDFSWQKQAGEYIALYRNLIRR